METSAKRRLEDLAGAPWRQLTDRDLAAARGVPTMLAAEEEQLYFWLAAEWAGGGGAIVDLGCFVGGSTARLAAGSAAAGHGAPIHAFDRFTASDRAKARFLYASGIPPFEGDDILPLAESLLAPWAGAITFHPGEIEDNGWDGGPIELLVSDAAKSASTADAIAEAFFPHLLPGRGLLVSQDHLLWNQPWLLAQAEMLAEFLTPVAQCAETTMIYRCTATPDAAALAAARTAPLGADAMIGWLERARPRLEAFGRGATIDRMCAAIRANPGERNAWRFERP